MLAHHWRASERVIMLAHRGARLGLLMHARLACITRVCRACVRVMSGVRRTLQGDEPVDWVQWCGMSSQPALLAALLPEPRSETEARHSPGR
jgi:hypothetical protein